jgi:uncharacterized protein (DUF1800 family)
MRTLKDVTGVLEPFRPAEDGAWDRVAAAHLTRRATFGSPPEFVDELLELGPEKAAKRLLEKREPGAGVDVVASAARHVGSLENVQGWWVYRMLRGAWPAIDKLALFWHGHFATSDTKIEKPRLMMRQIELFQKKGTGPFEDLLQEVSRDPAMLLWLDNNSNRRGKPNENFARELMELFSLGIGNYTEEDIKQAARAFTGWHVRRGEFWFNRRAHDDREKSVFGKKGTFGGEDVVKLCVETSSCPEFIATKLFEYYVAPDPAPELRTALGKLFASCGRNTGEFLAKLWSSRVFYAASSRRALVSSPADYVVGSLRSLGARANATHLASAMGLMGQDLLRPPTVKGWDTGMAWLNSNTLIARFRFAASLAGGDELQANVGWDKLEKDGVDGVVARLFPEGLPKAVLAALKEAAGSDLKLAVPGCLQLPEYQYV